MFFVLFFVAFSNADYAIKYESTGEFKAYKLGKCYYKGDGLYVRYEKKDSNLEYYSGSSCDKTVLGGSGSGFDKLQDYRLESKLPKYYLVKKTFEETTTCLFTDDVISPEYKYYPEGCITSEGESKKYSIDNNLVHVYSYLNSKCEGTGEIDTEEYKKCLINGKNSWMFTDSSVSLSFALAIGFLIFMF
ncbi:hypothetical protein EIN_118110 [Entamoeba invadens IP1]|uniref:Uncharacterized protein n=1 Tax=Entamoeba invadens IP1 TaxID=370355 RepID=L7FMZ1_ENTIV|nr:hypothetical protein EIN_118110 [Entamoeba invadens IP1]ELP92237.1 hypothetical protein EIN_118110 [Entamoeba invadens IP1]|eukprot:XP_004259008.1 hypothetical protein EIN_118110 [Entamoeba invadens IP1]